MKRAVFAWKGLSWLLAVGFGLSGCGGGGGHGGLSDYISRVSALSGGSSVNATLRSGHPPSGSGPSITANTTGGVVIPGGSTQLQISSGSSYSNVVVSVQGVDGYFELTGLTLSAGNTVALIITIGQNAPQTFTLQAAAGTGSAYGAAQSIPVQLTQVGTGDIQINVSWDVDSDVDLHVVEPGNAEIYYGNKGPTASGGQLDLDSNAGCTLDHKRSENVTWPSGRAPRGTYTVRVDLWSACNQPTTNYVVTVNVKGQDPKTFNGSFTAAQADGGGAGAGRMITTFTY